MVDEKEGTDDSSRQVPYVIVHEMPPDEVSAEIMKMMAIIKEKKIDVQIIRNISFKMEEGKLFWIKEEDLEQLIETQNKHENYEGSAFIRDYIVNKNHQ